MMHHHAHLGRWWKETLTLRGGEDGPLDSNKLFIFITSDPSDEGGVGGAIRARRSVLRTISTADLRLLSFDGQTRRNGTVSRLGTVGLWRRPPSPPSGRRRIARRLRGLREALGAPAFGSARGTTTTGAISRLSPTTHLVRPSPHPPPCARAPARPKGGSAAAHAPTSAWAVPAAAGPSTTPRTSSSFATERRGQFAAGSCSRRQRRSCGGRSWKCASTRQRSNAGRF